MTRFLVDECVDQKPIRSVPATEKGFDIAFPRTLSFTGVGDITVVKLAQQDQRVLVTSDSDFFRLHLKPNDVPEGVLWFHPPKSSKRAIQTLLEKFCRYRQRACAGHEYDFRGQMIEITDDGLSITTQNETEFIPWPEPEGDQRQAPCSLI
jgi:predicted nuclease of predicted toxin-antitoxin system